MALWRIDTSSAFAVSAEGLNEAPEMGAILLDRARALSRDPAHEDVLVLAHGPGDDAENERWLAYMDRLAEQTRSTLPFHRVQVATLREDWPEKRVEAQRAVRRFVESSRAAGRRTLVLRCASKDSVRTRRCSKGSTTRPTSSGCSRTAM